VELRPAFWRRGGDAPGPLLAEALDIADRIDDRVAQFYVLGALGCHAAFSARPGYAARLLGAAATEVGASVMPFLLPVLARAGQVAEAALGTARFQAERTAGEDLSRRAALELALGRSQRDDQADAAATERAGGSVQPLSNREADVARLLADGLTNRQIGARLYISERTVDSHVRNILNKLGFASRAQVAAWITSPD
jgi:DNA-binding CsgD family transcriptional regulator